MKIVNNVELKPYNTFGLEVRTDLFCEVGSEQDVVDLMKDEAAAALPKLVLGGGSNMLFLKDVQALTIRMAIPGILELGGDAEHVLIRSGAGVVWQDLVEYAVTRHYGGIENLSLIPGTVGAAPIQNIGAYGVELKDVFESLEAIVIATGERKIFERLDCRFGYRDSIFKREAKNQYIICSVTLRLKKQPVLNLGYGDIRKVLTARGIEAPTVRDVSDAVMSIRREKLPDPAVIGNAGSFFKNPEISISEFNLLKEKFSDLPGYPVGQDLMKIPAGWLIEQAGWKGYRDGAVGVHDRQALVLVNYGGGKGVQIKSLAEKIQASVRTRFNVELHPEVNFV